MASLPDFLDLLVDRVEATTPEVDPAIRFRHQPESAGATRQDRDFSIHQLINLEVQPVNSGDPVTAHLELEVAYAHRTDGLAVLKLAGQDIETLYQQIAYYPESSWAESSGYQVMIKSAAILPAGGGGAVITIAVDVLYNMRT